MGKANNITKILISTTALLLMSGGLAAAGDGWYDGERWRTLHEDPRQLARLELDVTGVNDPAGQRVRSVRLQSVEKASQQALRANQPVVQVPVFRDHPGGPVRVAIGGVILRLSNELSAQEQESWLASEGLSVIEAPEGLGWMLVDSQPGWPSLELANRLFKMPGVVQASPNWWRPTTRR